MSASPLKYPKSQTSRQDSNQDKVWPMASRRLFTPSLWICPVCPKRPTCLQRKRFQIKARLRVASLLSTRPKICPVPSSTLLTSNSCKPLHRTPTSERSSVWTELKRWLWAFRLMLHRSRTLSNLSGSRSNHLERLRWSGKRKSRRLSHRCFTIAPTTTWEYSTWHQGKTHSWLCRFWTILTRTKSTLFV